MPSIKLDFHCIFNLKAFHNLPSNSEKSQKPINLWIFYDLYSVIDEIIMFFSSFKSEASHFLIYHCNTSPIEHILKNVIISNNISHFWKREENMR